ncbi:MAG: glutamate--tRNA ligase, partial [Bacteroidetes bacterium]|nr:glutamate--tRNA ligase [Bacteroidota bacterium]
TGQSSVQFNIDKLNWYNGQFVRKLSTEEIASRAKEAVEEAVGPVDEAKLLAVADLMRERLTFAHDLADATYFFRDPDTYDETGIKKRWKDDSAELVRLYADLSEADETFTEESTEVAMRDLAETQGVGFGRIIHPVRLAATGTTVGAGMFETLVVIGREACIRRLRKAAELLG